MLEISRDFVRDWAKAYDSKASESDQNNERIVEDWLSQLPLPKHLDKEHFLILARWKSPRPLKHYEANDPEVIEEITRFASIAKHDLTKLNVLRALKGVNIRVASTILYFLHPDKFAIIDVRACRTLIKANLWTSEKRLLEQQLQVWAPTEEDWRTYVSRMREISASRRVTLRNLDKALWMYDKEPRTRL